MQIHILGQFMHEGVVSLMLAAVGGACMYPFRKIKNAYAELMTAVQATHAELVMQRQNCLATLASQGERQIELLGKTTELLDGVRLDLAKQTGILEAGAPRRRSKK